MAMLNNPSSFPAPDYTGAIQFSNFPYTAPDDGWVGYYIECSNNGGCWLSSSADSVKQEFGIGGNYVNQVGSIFPVKKGEKITASYSNLTTLKCFYYPNKQG